MLYSIAISYFEAGSMWDQGVGGYIYGGWSDPDDMDTCTPTPRGGVGIE